MKLGRNTIAFFLALVLCCSTLSLPQLLLGAESTPTVTPSAVTVVLDAGHGGEDAGASSAKGLREKDVNLAITFYLRDLLVANGIPVILTRETDILLYDKTVDFHGRKKALDLAARRKIAEETENCIFVSIHLNAFPQEQYSGLQVWYSQNNADSRVLAESVQALTQQLLQPQNNRQTKPATSSIYLLHHLQMPAVLVECGFLSNPEEAALLGQAEYQQQLAFLLFLSLCDGMEKIADNA